MYKNSFIFAHSSPLGIRLCLVFFPSGLRKSVSYLHVKVGLEGLHRGTLTQIPIFVLWGSEVGIEVQGEGASVEHVPRSDWLVTSHVT